MKKKKLLTLLGGICLVLVLAALPFMAACAKPAAPAGPIKIGALLPLTGPYAMWGGWMNDMIPFALDEINWQVVGRPIEVVIEDEGGEDISVALEKARKLVEADNVDVLIGPMYGGSRIAVYPYTSSIPVPAIFANASVPEAQNEYVVWIAPTYVDSQRPLGEYAYKKLGLRTVTTIGADYSCPYEFTQGFTDAFQELGGKLVQQQWAPLTETDYMPYLAGIKEADALGSTCLGPPAMMTLYTQLAELGLNKKYRMFQTESGSIPQFVMDDLGDILLGTLQCLPYHYAVDNPANKKFVADFQAKFDRMPEYFDMLCYVFIQAIAAGLEATGGDTDPDKLYQAMTKLKLDTVAGPISFNPEGQPITDMYICEVQEVGGKYTQVIVETIKGVEPLVYRGSPYKKFEER